MAFRAKLWNIVGGLGLHDVLVFIPSAVAWFIIAATNNWRSHQMVMSAMSLGFVLNARLVFGPFGSAIANDVIQHYDASMDDTKGNLRSTWTNTALVSALLLTVCLPMLQDENVAELCGTDSLAPLAYSACCFVAVGFSLLGVLQPSFALIYTDNLSARDTLMFLLCNPWSMGNPLACTASGVIWIFGALSIWTTCAHGIEAGIFGSTIAAWALWTFVGSVMAYSGWHPEHGAPEWVQELSSFQRLKEKGLTDPRQSASDITA